MKSAFILILIAVLCIGCIKEELPEINNPGVTDLIRVSSSSKRIPLNEYGVATLTTRKRNGDDITQSCDYYVNDQKLDGNLFKPSATGIYKIHSVNENLKSYSIEVSVEEPLNKKVLIEYFTSRTCGFCPWIGDRLDSLSKENSKAVSYSIHGQDELEINETQTLQDYLEVHHRPSVRIYRGFVRNYAAPIEIQRLIDSLHYFLSIQPQLEISIESALTQNMLSVNVLGQYYEEIKEDIYLSLVLVEDSIRTYNQSNYFSGYPLSINPYISLPNPLPEYNNHNVLRQFLSDPRGDKIDYETAEIKTIKAIGSYQVQIENIGNLNNAYVIAIVHKRHDTIEASSVLNCQIVKVGEKAGFKD